MYKIIGADGKVYGPINLAQLQQWATQGRVNPQTRIQPEGDTEWTPAAEVPEVLAALEAVGYGATFTPPAPPAGQRPGAALSSGLAITSLVLGILSVIAFCLGPLFGIPAIICGHIAHGRVRREPEQYGGGALAIAGFVLGYIGLVLGLLVLPAMLLPALSVAKQRAQSVGCANNLKMIGIAFKTWALDHNDEFPFNVSTNSGGTLELCSRDARGYERNSAIHFMVLSNHLGTPVVLLCPAERTAAGKSSASDFRRLQAANVSYLLRTGASVNETNGSAVLVVCPTCNNKLLVDGSVQIGKPRVRAAGSSE